MFKRIFLFMLTNVLVMVTISIVMSVLGVGHYMTSAGIDYSALAVFCLIWGGVGSFISLLMSKWTAKTMMGVQLVDERGQYAELVRKVHQMARAAGITKMPEVGVYNSPEVNAFATGPSKNNSLVAVSTGLLQQMTSDEVEGVLAHEVAHVANGDMVTMALVQGVINAFVLFFAKIAAFALQNALQGDRDNERSEGPGWAYYISEIVFQIAFSFLGMFVVAYFSRYREYRADAGGAKFAGRNKMIAALRRLQAKYESGAPLSADNDKMSAFKISTRKGKGPMAMLSTHPPLEERIAALERATNF
jgi:heat shock protein HtpX